jgi:hypothetical protein
MTAEHPRNSLDRIIFLQIRPVMQITSDGRILPNRVVRR